MTSLAPGAECPVVDWFGCAERTSSRRGLRAADADHETHRHLGSPLRLVIDSPLLRSIQASLS